MRAVHLRTRAVLAGLFLGGSGCLLVLWRERLALARLLLSGGGCLFVCSALTSSLSGGAYSGNRQRRLGGAEASEPSRERLTGRKDAAPSVELGSHPEGVRSRSCAVLGGAAVGGAVHAQAGRAGRTEALAV